ncbi:MAG: extracellular solute-binding protein [Alphaproteobacteria bacterium]|jgi:microcin C transport system substrate-binding protein|nr:extracellular solute-binding protein [Alphaproteobacteria bacterium]
MVVIIYALLLWLGIQGTEAVKPKLTPQGTHGVSNFGKMKYPPTFTHFDYTNPEAPKGGVLDLSVLGTFDSLNPYIVKGVPPMMINILTSATLLDEAQDRVGESYGYAAESVELAPDRSWVIFRLNPSAKFNNGDPITADDVIWVFETLRTKGLPIYRTYYKNISRVEKLDNLAIKFFFNTTSNHELPLILGQLPVLSKKYYTTHPFDETSLKPAPSSGPYEIATLSARHSITYKRIKNWWGASIPSQKGRHNFDKIKIDYYLERNAMFEGFKSGQDTLIRETRSENWATAYVFPAYKAGYVKREELNHSLSSGTYGLAFNIRRPLFKDIRVRKALTLMFDFPWINKHMFYGLFKRNTSFFPNSDFEAKGVPSPEEIAILQPFKSQMPQEVLTERFTLPTPQKEGDHRGILSQAESLLKEAGYEVRDGLMTNVKTGKPFIMEAVIYDKSLEKILLNYAARLEALGIQLKVRFLDTDAYQFRVDHLNYDMIFNLIPQSQSLGNEQRDYFGSERANVTGTRNVSGIQNPVVDKLIEKLIDASSYKSLFTYARALDRVLLWNYYMIPAWHSGAVWVAYWDRFSRPKILPKYHALDTSTWWFDREKDARLPLSVQTNDKTNNNGPTFWHRIKSWFA